MFYFVFGFLMGILLGRLTGRRPLDSMLMNAEEEPFLPVFVEVVLSCFVCGIWPFGLVGFWAAWALGCLGFGLLGHRAARLGFGSFGLRATWALGLGPLGLMAAFGL